MHIPALQILLICTSFLAWICLSSCGIILLYRYWKKLKLFKSTLPLLYIFWGISGCILFIALLCLEMPYILKCILTLWNIAISTCGAQTIYKLIHYLNIPHKFELLFPEGIDYTLSIVTSKKRRNFVPDEQQIKSIDEFINSSRLYTSKVTLYEMAEYVMIDKINLSIFIKQKYGASLTEINTTLRLNHAEELLLSPTEDYQGMADLAEKCGFESLSTFYQAFKDRHNISPLKWKEEVIQKMGVKQNS